MLARYPRKVANKSQVSRPFPTCFHPLSVLFLLPRFLSFSRPLLNIPPVDTMHGSRTNDVKTPRDDGRACDFFVGISGRNLICLIGVVPAGREIAGAKFEQSCILERRKFIGVTPVSSTRRQSLIFVANIARYLKHARGKVSPALETFLMRLLFFKNFYLSFRSWFSLSRFSLSPRRHHCSGNNFFSSRSRCLYRVFLQRAKLARDSVCAWRFNVGVGVVKMYCEIKCGGHVKGAARLTNDPPNETAETTKASCASTENSECGWA